MAHTDVEMSVGALVAAVIAAAGSVQLAVEVAAADLTLGAAPASSLTVSATTEAS